MTAGRRILMVSIVLKSGIREAGSHETIFLLERIVMYLLSAVHIPFGSSHLRDRSGLFG